MNTEAYYRVVYKDMLLKSLDEIYEYIAYSLQSEVNAKKQLKRIIDTIDDLNLFPYGYPKLNAHIETLEGVSVDIRKTFVDNYTIYFYVDDSDMTVNVVLVAYGPSNESTTTKKLEEYFFHS